MDRQYVSSSSNRNMGRAPALRTWYTISFAIGSPWFHDSTITFSFGWIFSVWRTTFFAKASYSDMGSLVRAKSPADKYVRPRAGRTEAPRSLRRCSIDPGDLPRGDDLVLEAVHLEGGMRDAEALPQPAFGHLDDAGGLLDGRVSRDGNVPGEGIQTRGDGPHVQVMDASHARDRPDRLCDLLGP